MGLFRPDDPLRRPAQPFIPTSPGGAPPAITAPPPFSALPRLLEELPWRPPWAPALPSKTPAAAATSMPPAPVSVPAWEPDPRRWLAAWLAPGPTARPAPPPLSGSRRVEGEAPPWAPPREALPPLHTARRSDPPPVVARPWQADGEAPRRFLAPLPSLTPVVVTTSLPPVAWRWPAEPEAPRRAAASWLPPTAAPAARTSLPPMVLRGPGFEEPARYRFRQRGPLWLPIPSAPPATAADLPAFVLVELDPADRSLRFEGAASVAFDGAESVRFENETPTVDGVADPEVRR